MPVWGIFRKFPCLSKTVLLPTCLLCACKGTERISPFFQGQLHSAWFCLDDLKFCLERARKVQDMCLLLILFETTYIPIMFYFISFFFTLFLLDSQHVFYLIKNFPSIHLFTSYLRFECVNYTQIGFNLCMFQTVNQVHTFFYKKVRF